MCDRLKRKAREKFQAATANTKGKKQPLHVIAAMQKDAKGHKKSSHVSPVPPRRRW